MLGIDLRFRGQPADSEWRYSRQIMSHLIAEAFQLLAGWPRESGAAPQWLVLQVHKDNKRAIHFYEQCGFELIPDVERIANHWVMKLYIGDE